MNDDHPPVYQEYDVRPFLECEAQYEKLSPPVQAAACTQIRGAGPTKMLEEWVEYHRLVGFQHFWIYVNDDPSVISNLPQHDYITYIPYNYCLCHHHEETVFSPVYWTTMPVFQTPVMAECILRARKEGIRWLALHDVDEYFQVMDRNASSSNNTNVIDYLETLPTKEYVGGFISLSVPFGRHPRENTTQELTMDYAWHKNYSTTPIRKGREKIIVRPDKVTHVGVHYIVSGSRGTYLSPDTQIRVAHFKNPDQGVFRGGRGVFRRGRDIVRDDSLAKSSLREQVYQRIMHHRRNNSSAAADQG